ncbi:MAG TPA: heme-copper oxidase subunit III [Candidatus Dormibacteraeota bacterium]|nr:heme-copper oxidase subunit III [Candidatus Dormibacteraeota bacterium]
MAGSITEAVEIIDAGRGGGTGTPAGGGDDGGSSSPLPPIPRRAYFTALQLGLAAIVMFFMALASSYIVRKGLGNDWQHTPMPAVVWFNTLILLASSGTIILARKKLEDGDREAFRSWWWVTCGLGMLFLAGQIIAWRQLSAAGILLSTNPSSSFFYLLTAAHGAHLAGGIFALFYVLFRPWKRSRISQATAAELASIYWHFMDGLWVFLLVLLTLGR